MAKYIKRDDLLSLIATLRNHRLLDKYGGAEAWKMAKALPAADVEPVRHGRWQDAGGGYVACSECGEEHSWIDYRASYCENCGAKMDGEVTE